MYIQIYILNIIYIIIIHYICSIYILSLPFSAFLAICSSFQMMTLFEEDNILERIGMNLFNLNSQKHSPKPSKESRLQISAIRYNNLICVFG